MNAKHNPKRPPMPVHSSVAGFQGDNSGRRDPIHIVTLDGKDVEPDRIFNAREAIRESIEEAFGRSTTQTRKNA